MLWSFDCCETILNRCFRGLITLVACLCASDAAIPTTRADEPPAEPAALKSPVSPRESLKYFALPPGLRIELVACEPNVIDPVAMAFDETGRLWVAEYTDYPHGPSPGKPPLSRIRLLQDRDGDGFFETSTVFADKLLFANGLQPWRGGVIVTLSGEIVYFRDTTGDGKADLRETWFTGFREENSQLRANHPTFAFDNHVYVANGTRGGSILPARKDWRPGSKAVPIGGMDFRFDPVTGQSAAISGFGQFGMTFDDFGNRFLCTNRNPCKHVVLENRYLARNPFLAVPAVTRDVSPSGDESHVFPISRTWTTSFLHEGQFTAACGVTIYRGDALPGEFYGNSFTCEPTGNLVHRDVLTPDGPTFSSHPGRKGTEFLATRDEWFRGVNLAHGPDGALYVVDMYRAVIEHPQFVPDELKNRPDLLYGNDRGRIYRVVAEDGTPPRNRAGRWPSIATATEPELVALLQHPNAWQRETAARLLFERQDQSVRPQLSRLLKDGRTPQSRMLALWVLEGLAGLEPGLLEQALRDPHPGVREHAVRLSEKHLHDNKRLANRILELADDDNPRLRFQVALSLGEMAPSDEVLDALARIAARDADDPWTRTAVLSSASAKAGALMSRLLSRETAAADCERRGFVQLVEESAECVGSGRRLDEIQNAIDILFRLTPAEAGRNTPPSGGVARVQYAGINGISHGLERRGGSLDSLIKNAPPVQSRMRSLCERAAEVALDSSAPVPLREDAIGVLKHAGFRVAMGPLKQLVLSEPEEFLRRAAVEAFSAYEEPDVGNLLLTGFSGQSPAMQRAILDALLADRNRTKMLLDRMEQGAIPVSVLNPYRASKLTKHSDPEIRRRASAVLASATPADRREVLERYKPALSLAADPNRGREIFARNCAVCHKVGGLGVEIGPDIADSRGKTLAGLLTDVLDPNRAVDTNYFSYTVATADGKVINGLVSTETSTSITLRQAENKSVIVLRADVDEMHSDGVSLMPVGFEKQISVEQMADLISYLKNWRYLEGQVPIEIGR